MPIMLVNIFCFYFLELLIQFLNKIGGIGSSIFGRIINSGVSNGLIKGNSAAAGLVMNVDNTPISQSYVKESVTINAPQASGFIFVFRSSRGNIFPKKNIFLLFIKKMILFFNKKQLGLQ
eukprot:TRINITY_DN4918_c0_g1_i1.p1 TRINITY_DN4918_c0_g1~~TRINITY_DN4918_c0_g1_i1.p1  ORF type:complete len:120 (-),score=11.48 TRINITY_DN4918_c0_g1_i1:461-820(-)